MLLPCSIARKLNVGTQHVMTNWTALPLTSPANMTTKSSPSPVKGETMTRSGQIRCQIVRLGINT